MGSAEDLGPGALGRGRSTVELGDAASDEHARTLVASPDEALVGLGPAPGTFVGRYLVVGQIGVGGMGRVLRAYDPKLRREIALKLLRTGGSSTDRARILREARAMAQLNHPHVVAVYDVDETVPSPADPQSRVFVAMEYIAGRTLRDWLVERPRSWRDVLMVMLQVGEALAAAHAAGLVHRDVKPSNILVGDDGRVRIGDFGLARADADPSPSAERASREPAVDLGDDEGWDSALTRADTVMGTPTYMSPEQHEAGATDARSDQYGFCVTLWGALFGAVPFAGHDLGQLLAAKRSGPPSPPPGTDVPRWLVAVVTRGLASEPAGRHGSMAALLQALRDDPTRRRNRWLGVAVVLVLGAGGLGIRELDRRSRHAQCEAEGRTIESVWGPTTRQRLAAAAAELPSPLGADAWQRLAPWLDGYAAGWTTLRTDACTATELDRSASTDTLARARQCLDERRDHLAALLDTLGEPDAKLLQRAITAAVGLPALEACADPDALRRLPMVSDPALRDEHAAVNRRIADALSQRALGRYDQAVSIADEALARAEALDWAPLEARASIVRGQTLERLGKITAASAALETAAFRAAAAGHDAIAADATTALVATDGERRRRFDDGLRWSWVTQVFLERAGAHDDLRVATWQAHLGGLQRARGATDEALEAYARALDIRVGILGESHPEVAVVLNARGGVHLDRGDLDAANADFRRALELRTLTYGPNSALVATTLTMLGEVTDRQGDHDGALALYHRSLATWEQEFGASHPQVSAVYEKIGHAELAAGRVPAAIAAFERGLALAEASYGPDDPDHAATLLGLAEAQLAAGDVAAAATAAERAEALAQRDPIDAGALARARLVLARVRLTRALDPAP